MNSPNFRKQTNVSTNHSLIQDNNINNNAKQADYLYLSAPSVISQKTQILFSLSLHCWTRSSSRETRESISSLFGSVKSLSCIFLPVLMWQICVVAGVKSFIPNISHINTWSSFITHQVYKSLYPDCWKEYLHSVELVFKHYISFPFPFNQQANYSC